MGVSGGRRRWGKAAQGLWDCQQGKLGASEAFSTSVSSPIKGGGRTVPEAPSNWHSYNMWALDGSRKDLCRLLLWRYWGRVSEPQSPHSSIVTITEEPAFAEHLRCDRRCLRYMTHLTLVAVLKQVLFLASF